jgi:hypothetical protein
VGEFTPCFLRVVARFSAHADPNTLILINIVFGLLLLFTLLFVYRVIRPSTNSDPPALF